MLEDGICLKIKLIDLGTHCPSCQNFTTEINQNRPLLVRDLPCFDKVTYLQVPDGNFIVVIVKSISPKNYLG
ncbi:transposase family protein [Tychonema sp. LEGE 07199]|uniref:transposase family protein n=1 Tax=unclassified Tychonema TaxID=2642144 RepID=UPI0018822BAF|nr:MULTISPECIES: transposase family protein [unclassified Tychonema]MBE9124326.1 transposase family protein [Tychonema sp. LEGE 07199]MBE9130470.1 transposase family protein [Tychonema sp. LEGE 07196]